ncbi:MAG: hypothetical protein JNL10_01170 [Verrucomicrobiales bacterium]|nr:hypothetical protein [Verrucomicrobiales bacterium]
MNPKAVHPIIYVRGYAMTQGEIEDTVADPYMGFNLGSCKTRQLWDGTVKKFFFESPLVRLMKEYGYDDVYDEGMDQVADEQAKSEAVPYHSLVIYRYYEPSSKDLGNGVKPDIHLFGLGLADLIVRLRDRIFGDKASIQVPDFRHRDDRSRDITYLKKDFRVYLVAHSMGGLVCRAFLQNPKLGEDQARAAEKRGDKETLRNLRKSIGNLPEARAAVDKVFTYATPHNGIDVRGVGNVPDWMSLNGLNTFSRDEMADYLGLRKSDRPDGAVDIVTNFDPDRFFNLVGTNPGDYKVAMGLASWGVGELSDGLVRISNATTRGWEDGVLKQSPNAFVHRSHSGYFGIVNSEEGYQNLVRFLYGDIRADGYLEVDELTLPPEVQKEYDANKEVRASYLFEVTASIRGKQWQLHRRTANENSAVFRKFDELFPKWNAKTKGWVADRAASPLLFNVFLDRDQSQTGGKTLAFAADLCVRVPEYQVDGFLFLKNHFEGGYLFRDLLNLEATPPATSQDEWKFMYQFASQRDEPWKEAAIVKNTAEDLTFEIPVEQPKPPGIKARLRITTTFWNP